jgi:putative membrane protein
MTLVLLKFLHVATISIWAAGLLALPTLYMQRASHEGDGLYRLHAFTRFLYVALISPAAFLAIGSGTALIFLRETYEAWFSAKLVLVAAMTGIHIFSGLVILRLFEPQQSYPAWRGIVVMTATTVVSTGILVLVLGKPALPSFSGLDPYFEPGALQGLVGNVIAWSR